MNYTLFNKTVDDENDDHVWAEGESCPKCNTEPEEVDRDILERDSWNWSADCHTTVPCGVDITMECNCGFIHYIADHDDDIDWDTLEIDGQSVGEEARKRKCSHLTK